MVQSSPNMDVDIFVEEVEDFIGEGGSILGRPLHFWEKKILAKKHLKAQKISKEERAKIPCSPTYCIWPKFSDNCLAQLCEEMILYIHRAVAERLFKSIK